MKKRVKILVIDDVLIIRNLFRRFLEPQGYKVMVTANAQEGLDIAKKENFDVVFIDVVMPEMDGIATMERLRGILPKSKIVIMTGYADDEHIKMVLNSGIEVFAKLYKPFDIGEVEDIIKRATQ